MTLNLFNTPFFYLTYMLHVPEEKKKKREREREREKEEDRKKDK